MQDTKTLRRYLIHARPLLAAVATVFLLWGLYNGVEQLGSRQGRLILFLCSMTLFALALVPEPSGRPGSPAATQAKVPAPSGATGRVEGAAPLEVSASPPGTTQPSAVMPAEPAQHPAPIRENTMAAASAQGPPIQPASSPHPTSAQLLQTTVGDLLLDAVGDDPEDAARLLARAITRALHPPALALSSARDG